MTLLSLAAVFALFAAGSSLAATRGVIFASLGVIAVVLSIVNFTAIATAITAARLFLTLVFRADATP